MTTAAAQAPETAGMVRPVQRATDGVWVDLVTLPQEVQDAYDTVMVACWEAFLLLEQEDAEAAAAVAAAQAGEGHRQ